MLALVSMFLATFVISAIVIWVYRIFFGVQNYEGRTVGKKRAGGTMKLSAQQGYISLRRKSDKQTRRSSARTVKPKARRVAAGGNKVPWGW